MSGAPKLRSLNVTDSEAGPILGPAGNNAMSTLVPCKLASKPLRETERVESDFKVEKKASSVVSDSLHLLPPLSAVGFSGSRSYNCNQTFLRMLLALRMHLRIHSAVVLRREEFGRPSFTSMRKQTISKSNKSVWLLEKIVSDDAMEATVGTSQLKKRCSWVHQILIQCM